MQRTFDQLAVLALLDDDQPRLKRLLHAAQVAYAIICPKCGSKDVERNHEGDEAFCPACDDYWNPKDKATDELTDMGYDVEVV
jgi:uncharacterized Zn finger protein (UPF0148 family)